MFAQDYIEPIDAPQPDGCDCEQALQTTCDKFKQAMLEMLDTLASLKQAEREAWQLAQEVLQSVTLDEAKRKASVYLGLTDPF